MPTIIDSLIVTLGLDSKDVDAKAPGVRKKLKDIENAAIDVEGGARKMGDGFKSAASSLGIFLGALGGAVAIRAFVRDVTEANTQLFLLSRSLGMSVNSLFSLGAAGRMAGVGSATLQSLAASLRAIPGQLEAGQQPPLITLLARAGVNWMGSSPQEQMEGLARFFARMPKNVALGLGESSGLSFAQMEFLLQGEQKVQEEIRENRQFSPTRAQNAQLFRLHMQIVELGLAWRKVGIDVLSEALPAIQSLLHVLQELAAWSMRHTRIVTAVAAIVAALAGLVVVGKAITFIVGALKSLAMIAAVLDPWVAVFVALAAAILLLWNDYKVWSEGGRSLFDWSGFVRDIKEAGHAFEDLARSITDATESFFGWIRAHDTPRKVGQAIASGFRSTVAAAGRLETMHGIATAEGFYGAHGNIPQRAHNPGDIEYGEFARSHGATGWIVAKGGQKIATFRSTMDGWKALYDLLGTKGYVGLSNSARIARYTGLSGNDLNAYMANMARGERNYASSLASGGSAASMVASLGSSVTHHSISNDNSTVNNIGTLNIVQAQNGRAVTPGVARGMDFGNIIGQSNAGSF